MTPFRLQSAAQQVAAHLSEEIRQRRWTAEVPGVHQLARELGVNPKTVDSALRQLEWEGVLTSQGPRRPRLVAEAGGSRRGRTLRVMFLPFEEADKTNALVLDLYHRLVEAGHRPSFAHGNLTALDMDLERVAKLVARAEADAWVVLAGSRPILEWFAAREQPVFALFGRHRPVSIAGTGPDKVAAFQEVGRTLAQLGHRRIVLLARDQHSSPEPGSTAAATLEAFNAAGIPVNSYNVPTWDNTREGFHQCLEELFQFTPPTALITIEALLFAAAEQFILRRGLRVPEDVSLVCDDPDPTFAWRRPSVAHVSWEPGSVIPRRLLGWARKVSRGEADTSKAFCKAEFIMGDTVGPAPRSA